MNDTTSPIEPAGKLRRVVLDMSPPRAVHLLSWTRAGSQVLLELGYFDLRAIHQQRQPDFKGERVLDWFVTDRFIVDFETANRFAASFQELADHLATLKEGGDDVTAGEG